MSIMTRKEVLLKLGIKSGGSADRKLKELGLSPIHVTRANNRTFSFFNSEIVESVYEHNLEIQERMRRKESIISTATQESVDLLHKKMDAILAQLGVSV